MYLICKSWQTVLTCGVIGLALSGCQAVDPFSKERVALEQQQQHQQQQQAALAQQQQRLDEQQRSLETAMQELREQRQQMSDRHSELQQKVEAVEKARHALDIERLQIASSRKKLQVGPMAVMGAVEKVCLPETDLILDARIDTGAETSSIHAEKVTRFERDGKRYVRFELTDPDTGQVVEVESKVVRRVRIKSTWGDDERRLVVKMPVVIGSIVQNIDLTLADRGDFEFPILIGRNLLKDYVVVDVSREYIASTKDGKKCSVAVKE